jgi:hypothetical protein
MVVEGKEPLDVVVVGFEEEEVKEVEEEEEEEEEEELAPATVLDFFLADKVGCSFELRLLMTPSRVLMVPVCRRTSCFNSQICFLQFFVLLFQSFFFPIASSLTS